MVFQIDASSRVKRAGIVLSTLLIGGLLALTLTRNFIASVLTDDRVTPSRELLAWGVTSAPNSAPLQARFAEAEMFDDDRDLSAIEARVARAINISPWDYSHRLLMAKVKEVEGDRAAAEAMLREALALAPNYTQVHWRLANLLVRQGKLSASVPEFRKAISGSLSYLPSTLDLVWHASGGNLVAVKAVTPAAPGPRLALAQFLLNQQRAEEAVEIFDAIDAKARLASTDSSHFIGGLIARGHYQMARDTWIRLLSWGGDQPRPAVWNGGFESDMLAYFSHFDWNIIRSDYARIGVDDTTAHGGSRSLRVEFAGRDTTRLIGEIKQLIVARPGSRCRLEFFVKTERLETPEGPRVVIMDGAMQKEVASSAPVAAGSEGWRKMGFDFVAPEGPGALYIYIKRMPKFSYDDPTRGTVWFDDFALTESTGK